MALPIRERVLQALAARLNAVRGLEQYDERDLPLTVIVEGEENADDGDYDLVRVTLPVTIARVSKFLGAKDDEWHQQANADFAALIKEVYTGGEDLGGLAQGIDYTGGGIDVVSDGARGTMVQAFFNIRYAFTHGDPFSNTVE